MARNFESIGSRYERSQRQANDHLARLSVPISETGRAAFKKASEWGASIPPELAEAIADAVLETAGLTKDQSEKRPVFWA